MLYKAKWKGGPRASLFVRAYCLCEWDARRFMLTSVGFAVLIPRMKSTHVLSLVACIVLLGACSETPKMFWSTDDNKPDYASAGKDSAVSAESRVPLDVPPTLRDEISVPMPDKVAVAAARGDVKMTAEEKEAVAGKAVSLDTRLYKKTAPEVFSSVVDAMTSLNLPVESVDSPSGTITSAWVRKDATEAASYFGAAMNAFGLGSPIAVRYRFIVRVYRMPDAQTQLQIRTLGQAYTNRHWVYKEIKRKVADEVFSATEERLGVNRGQTQAPLPTGEAVATPAPEVTPVRP